MSDRDVGGDAGPGGRGLKAALRRARLSEAEHSDVIVDLRAAEVARLEVLADELAPVIAELPPDTDLIDCSIVPGHPPRLWIDMLGYVVMARDKRTYQLISESRAGRQVLFESDNAKEVAAKATDYIAHRLIERERMAEGARLPRLRDETGAASAAESARGRNGAAFWQVAFAFVLGVVSGILAMLVMALIVTG